MKVLFTTLFLLTGLLVFSQVDSVGLKTAMQQLDNALLGKNCDALDAVLSPDVSFGHSSGWAQTQTDFIQDCRTGKLVYNKLDNSGMKIIAINRKMAIVRMTTMAEGSLNNNPFKLTLHVMQVWIKTKKGWQLFARQSAKL